MGYPIEERLKNVEAAVQDLSASLFTGHPEQDVVFQGVVTDVVTAEDCSSSYLVVRPYDPKAVSSPDGFLRFDHVNVNPMDGTDPNSRLAIVFADNVPTELYGVYYKLGEVINYRRYSGNSGNALKVIGSFVTHKDDDLGFWARVKPASLAQSLCTNSYTFTAVHYDINGSTDASKFLPYTLCSGATFTGQCKNLSQLLGTTEAVPNALIAEQVLKVYPFPNPVKGGTPAFSYFFNYTANQVMRGLVDETPTGCPTSVVVRSCADGANIDPDHPGTTTTLSLPHNTGDGSFVGLNATSGTSVQFLATGPHTGVLLNPYKSFDVKYVHTTGAPEVPDCESIRFNDVDFDITEVTLGCDKPTAAKIAWNGLTVEAAGYSGDGAPTTTCNAKVVRFAYESTGDEVGSDKYGVAFTGTDDTETDPCNGTTDVLKRAVLTGHVYVKKPNTTDLDVVVAPITATCNDDGTITINYSTQTIRVFTIE